MRDAYDSDYFNLVERQSDRSAEAVVPVLLRLLEPSSVVDVGCGTGAWLKHFRGEGIEEIHGIDGAWVDRSSLQIPAERFEVVDLARPSARERSFDLVVSLEVAEHLPPGSAEGFVELLTSLGDAVAFSAAIPGQGGTGHVNEQWPSYWSERFAARGFAAFDAVRPEIWNDERIAWWFRQNLVLYVREERFDDNPRLAGSVAGEPLSLVHPELFEDRVRALAAPAPAPDPVTPPAIPAIRPTALQRLRSKARLRTRLQTLRECLRQRRRRRILALVPIRDEIENLPDLFRNLEGQVDGVVALDDGSTDGSRELLESHPLVIELRTLPPGAQEEMEDGRNHLTLMEMAWKHGPDWFLGIDADERVERGFRRRAEAEIDRAEAAGDVALWVPFRELWGSRDRFRVDGAWGQKRKACLFKADPDARYDKQRLHSVWAPWPPPRGDYPRADLNLYHLKMIRAEDRQARADLYNRLDPEREYQAIGYDYLIDEEGIELEPVDPARDFVP
ncbi:MAG TPA: methyltransferase domain-containing protein [Solirubrobacterales bacterium]|nr:methyltransferase domain-containing protein [Solirubrobacterales bacterium]